MPKKVMPNTSNVSSDIKLVEIKKRKFNNINETPKNLNKIINIEKESSISVLKNDLNESLNSSLIVINEISKCTEKIDKKINTNFKKIKNNSGTSKKRFSNKNLKRNKINSSFKNENELNSVLCNLQDLSSENAKITIKNTLITDENGNSTSILDLPWLENTTIIEQEIQTNELKILPAFHDPLLLEYKFVIPYILEYILKQAKNINFSYKLTASNYIEIKKAENVIFKSNVIFYGNEIKIDCKNVFLIESKKFIKKENIKEHKTYLESINLKKEYRNIDMIQNYRKELFLQQIQKKVNYYYIENYEDLLNSFKSIVKNNDYKREYIPKVKSFDNKDKQKYLEYVIACVPGISQSVAKALGSYFGNFRKFYDFLKKDTNHLENILIVSDDKKNERNLGEKQSELLKKAFLCKTGKSILN